MRPRVQTPAPQLSLLNRARIRSRKVWGAKQWRRGKQGKQALCSLLHLTSTAMESCPDLHSERLPAVGHGSGKGKGEAAIINRPLKTILMRSCDQKSKQILDIERKYRKESVPFILVQNHRHWEYSLLLCLLDLHENRCGRRLHRDKGLERCACKGSQPCWVTNKSHFYIRKA